MLGKEFFVVVIFNIKFLIFRSKIYHHHVSKDCWINHYNSYDWSELEEYDIAGYLETLGWTESMWDDKTDTPVSEGKDWEDLSDAEKAAAVVICYTQQLWDEEPLTYCPDEKTSQESGRRGNRRRGDVGF